MGKHYAITDLHGMYDIYEQVHAMLAPDDVVYFLGDAVDRGYESYRLVKALRADSQWIWIMGNHDDYLRYDMQLLKDGYYKNIYDMSNYASFDFFAEWQKDGADMSLLDFLTARPLIQMYKNERGQSIYLTHSGFTFGCVKEMQPEKLLFNREHFNTKWDEKTYPHVVCIHGHTPIEYMPRFCKAVKRVDITKPSVCEYCNGHKINIDNGVFYTGFTVLYDLDEMQPIPLYDRVFKNYI